MSAPTPSLDTTLDSTEIHDILRNDRRRQVLEQLQEEPTLTLRELSESIAAVEAGESPAPRNVRQSVYVSLHQTHLPKLDDLNVVTYDSDGKTVELDSQADDVTVYMEVVPEEELSWGEFYLGLGLLGLVTVVGHGLGVPTVSAIDIHIWAGILLGLFVLTSTYQVLSQSETLFRGH